MNAPFAPPPGPLHRRTVLAGLLGLAATAPLGLARAAAPVGATGWAQADEATLARLLDRVTWGNTAQGAQALPPQGVAAYLAAQLRPPPATLPRAAQAQIDAMAITRTPLPVLAARMEAQHQAAKAQPTEDGRKAAPKAWQQDMRALQQEAAERFVLRALYSPTQLREKMTWFWMNHFSVFAGKGPCVRWWATMRNAPSAPMRWAAFATCWALRCATRPCCITWTTPATQQAASTKTTRAS